jgi:hypothetical protein
MKQQPSASDQLPLAVGAKVVALRDFGAIRKGLPGIITGTAREPFFQGNRSVYLCTFADNMKSLARPKEVASQDHDYSLEDLECASFVDMLARRKAGEEPAALPSSP